MQEVDLPDLAASPAPIYAPANSNDLFLPLFVGSQCDALQKIVDRLAQRLPGEERQATLAAIAIFGELPLSDRAAIVTHPLYQSWWLRLCKLYRAGKLTSLRIWMRSLASFVAVPAIEREILPSRGLAVPYDDLFGARFPAHSRRVLLGKTGIDLARVTAGAAEVYVASGARQVTLSRSEFIASDTPASPSLWRPCQIEGSGIEGSRIDVDETDPWTCAFLEDLNKLEPPPGRTQGDLKPMPLEPLQRHRLSECLRLLRSLWPQMADEFKTNVRMVVPFASEAMEAFTNTGWQGAVFLRTDFRAEWFLLERLVHESSHLRLNVIMACEKVHNAGPEERLPSPFRAGLRPVNGLYHGAFVFTRSAQVLQQLYRVTRDDTVARRVVELNEKVEASFAIIDRQVSLTEFGRSLLDQIRQVHRSIMV